ncbi:YsnF/AvaK domain-containing protein [Rhodocytophaga rosea]|uniref:YsnF/AvaK domain-containing protein n=1 Tax=Rhodocytophaga rosea TaxID=2704465 RepID=A0A6C0GKI9_9BACT|nr:YsnF/AvaK domain-containing protein [Rhodocytophaga rosea]QHT68528.1 YsnF/AvaK domain-containing protein [Rhodocytophaga rosea]
MNQTSDSQYQPEQERTFAENQVINESAVIPVIEEQVHVSKQQIETGKVLVSKKVHEEEKTIDIPLVHEEHTVERIPVNQYVEKAPEVRYEGDTMIIPVLREEVIIQKRLFITEELRITKRKIETSVPQQVTLRREEVIVERIAGNSEDIDTGIPIRPKENNLVDTTT